MPIVPMTPPGVRTCIYCTSTQRRAPAQTMSTDGLPLGALLFLFCILFFQSGRDAAILDDDDGGKEGRKAGAEKSWWKSLGQFGFVWLERKKKNTHTQQRWRDRRAFRQHYHIRMS